VTLVLTPINVSVGGFSLYGDSTVTLGTGMFSGNSSTNYNNSSLNVGYDIWDASNYTVSRFYLYFGFKSQIPAGATIVSATLELECSGTVGATFSVYYTQVLDSWMEGTITWNDQPTRASSGYIFTSPSSAGLKTLNVKSYVENVLSNFWSPNYHGTVIKVQSEATVPSSSKNVSYRHKEYGGGMYSPTLTIEFIP